MPPQVAGAAELGGNAHGIRVLEVVTERSSLRELHATVRAKIQG
ncbi:hypothetical protein [Nocardia cyriacigeorgica]|nr:hypothetical protein [Nocardia cyriacigeorgica]